MKSVLLFVLLLSPMSFSGCNNADPHKEAGASLVSSGAQDLQNEKGSGSVEDTLTAEVGSSEDPVDSSDTNRAESKGIEGGMIDDGTGLIRDPVRKQKRQIVSKGGVLELTFDDLKFDIEPGEPFEREKLSDDIYAFDGKKIKIRGFIRPSFKADGITSFVFVRDDKECCFGPQAAIYDCIIVRLAKGITTSFTVIPITVEGTFYLKEKNGPDGTVWSIFKMRNAKVL